jgi:LAO/AO transport system kinase
MPKDDLSQQAIETLAKAVQAGDRRALAQAITLIESTRQDHRETATRLISCLPTATNTIRIGISGPPGAGKSTFIGAIGQEILNKGHHLAVLTVDPSSPISGGSILGDKTRMEALSRDKRAFIRPSPSRGTLGGATHSMREVILLCESAGYNYIIVETVGVGQSEIAVASMVDLVLLLLSPGGGDDLQGIKKGIIEIADLLVVTKADGDLEAAALRLVQDYQNAIHLLRISKIPVTVTSCSAFNHEQIKTLLAMILDQILQRKRLNLIDVKRKEQRLIWMWSIIDYHLKQRFLEQDEIIKMIPTLENAVKEGDYTPLEASDILLKQFFKEKS